MNSFAPRPFIELYKSKFINNIKNLKKIIGSSELGVVVKANAYGHGIQEISQICNEMEQVDWLLTAGSQEAIELRNSNISKKILCMSYIDSCYKEAIKNKISLVIYDLNTLQELDKCANKLNTKAAVHLKIDTGMGRLGIQYHEVRSFINKIKSCKNIILEGIFSHFCDIDNEDLSYSYMQLNSFENIIKKLKELKIDVPFRHMHASGSLITAQNKHDLVRIGGLAYGLWKSQRHKERFANAFPSAKFEQIFSLKSPIIQIKNLPKDSSIGYARKFKTTRDTVLAILPLGYFDSFIRRAPCNNAVVMIENQFAPIIGNISMNMLAIDITDVKNANIKSIITLIGSETEIDPLAWAKKTETIPNEIVTKSNPLITRRIII